MLFSVFITAWVVALSGALMPGPLLTITIDESFKRGAWAGPLIVIGHGILEFMVVVAFVFGLQHFLALPQVDLGISLAGGVLLGFMSLGLLRVAKNPPASLPWENAAAASGGSFKRWAGPIGTGVLASLANPYWFLWWATIGAAMLSQARPLGMAGIGAFYSGHIMGDLAWYTVVSAVVASGRRWFNRQAYRWVMGICGLFLVILAAYFLFHALLIGSRFWAGSG